MSHPIAWFHENHIHRRRVDVLATHLARQVGQRTSLLDVGCGDGRLAAEVGRRCPDAALRGIDVLVREETAIPVDSFDGLSIPFDDDTFDSVMLVDVLHHTDHPGQLLAEAARVATDQVLIKDHYRRGLAAQQTLAFMDRVGNERHGVEIPCNYLDEAEWSDLLVACKLQPRECHEHLGLYPPPLSWLFERRLHFLADLQPTRP